MTLRRWLAIAATVEVSSLAVLLLNRFTVHLDPITSSMGPIHGFAYLATIALAALSPIPRAAKAFAWIPVVGGVVALRLTRPRAGQATDAAPGDGSDGTSARPAASPAAPHDPGSLAAPAAPVRDLTAVSDAAIVARGLVKAYRSGTRVGPLDLSIPRGRITGLIGPNGAGKTTALRMLVGLVRPTAGGVTVDGAGVDERGALDRVGALIEAPALVPGLTGRRNAQAVAALAGWDDADVDAALARVGLAGDAGTRVAEYSLGMRQRLALAIALLHDPRIVVLDEPANGLDPHGIAELRAFLRRLADEGVTVLVSSHLLGEIEQICDHLVLLADGVVAYEGPTRGLLDEASVLRVEPLHADDLPRLADVVRAASARPIDVADGEVSVAGDRELAARILVAATDAGIRVAQLRVDAPTLEEAFFRMTTSRTAPSLAGATR